MPPPSICDQVSPIIHLLSPSTPLALHVILLLCHVSHFVEGLSDDLVYASNIVLITGWCLKRNNGENYYFETEADW